MELKIRNVHQFKEVKISEGTTLIDMGLLNEQEAKELAVHLVSAAWDLCPTEQWKAQKWIESILNELDIEIPTGIQELNCG